MRMWMVEPGLMCNRHLLGEHGELHKFLHNWRKKYRITGRKGAIEPLSYKDRHEELVKEMILRGMNHGSPIEQPDFGYLPEEERNYRVDREESYKLLIGRCEGCRKKAR